MIRGLALAIAIICFPSHAHAQFTCPAHQWVNGSGFGGTTRCAQPNAADISAGTFSGSAFFGSGQPWIDVKSGANGCAVAAGNASTDDSGAIQCQINFMNSTYAGGIVYFPPANYRVASTVTDKGGVILVGAGEGSTSISIATDITAINFDATVFGGGLTGLLVFGNQSSSATQNLVTVANNARVNLSYCTLNGGLWALQTGGVDGVLTACTVTGWGTTGGGILSTGANWYDHCRCDQPSSSVTAGFKQGASSVSVFENHFVNSDFSGMYTDSVIIADTNNNAVTTFVGSVFSAAISITGGKYTMFASDEFGAAVASSVNESVVGSYGLASLTFTGAGTRNCAGNSNITC